MSNELITFDYQGQSVAFDPTARMWSLTEMHQASGSPKNKEPGQWLRGAQACELMTALDARETMGNSHSISVLVETREGRNGGTWAHWQIAAAYAHYLRPDFYLQWNEWAMERVTGQGQGVDVARFTALEARVAALEGTRGRQARVAALEGTRGRQARQERTPVLHLATIEVLEALKACGGSAHLSDLRKALPFVKRGALKVRLGRMRNRGLLTQPSIGHYALPKKPT